MIRFALYFALAIAPLSLNSVATAPQLRGDSPMAGRHGQRQHHAHRAHVDVGLRQS